MLIFGRDKVIEKLQVIEAVVSKHLRWKGDVGVTFTQAANCFKLSTLTVKKV